MKLSEAIRLGAMLKPQAFEEFSDDTTSCALRAAIEALGIENFGQGLNYSALLGIYPWLDLPGMCPACELDDFADADWVRIIYHLNDQHHWTREQIADWVETIEQQQDAATAPALVAVSA